VIAGLVLAAGLGTRFGGTKVLASLHGTALVRHVVDRLLLAGLSPVVVVGGEAWAAIAAACEGTGAQVVENPDPEAGLSGSLRLAVTHVPASCDAFVVALGDQPFIEPEVVRRLVGVWESSNAAAVVPEYRDGRGNPVLFDSTMRRHLVTLTGDRGARDLLTTLGSRVGVVAVDSAAPRDVDRPGDLTSLEG